MANIVAQLAITLDEAGAVNINGPLENRLLCYGLMEMAKEALQKHAAESAKQVIAVPPGTQLRPFPKQV